MATETLIAPTLAAVSTQVGFDTSSNAVSVIHADNLAGAETATVYIRSGATWVTAKDNAGAVYRLSATVTMLSLPNGPVYGVLKDATAGACGIYLSKRRQARS